VASPFERDEISSSKLVFASEERPIRFQDVDAAGTIYYARIFEYFGDVYVRMLNEAGLDMPRALLAREAASPLAHAEAQYLAPLVFGDRVTVKLVLARVGKTSTSYAYRVEKGGVVAAVGQTVHVWIDPRTFSAVPVPDAVRKILESKR
jgi:YbgC/YbaW family acyl-CoA thioester hydrolase